MDVDRSLVAVPVGAPDAVEQLLAAEREAAVLGEELQQVELARRQRNDTAGDSSLAKSGVDIDVADGDDVVVRTPDAIGPAQDRLDPGNDLPGRERLGDVVVGAQLEAEHAIDLAVAGGEHEHGDVGRRPKLAAHVEAVETAGETDIQDHQAWPLALHANESFVAVGGLNHAKALAPQVQIQQIRNVGVVLDHDNGPDIARHASSVAKTNKGSVKNRLDHIVAAHRATAAHRPAPRGFRAALAAPGMSVIAEIKRRSPSKGDLAPDLDPALIAKAYVAGGAAALSVLTDEEFFGGSVADLAAARAAVDVPVLRKDFTVSEVDVCDARVMGADAVLLIVAALSDTELSRFHRLARDLDLDVLVEVHDGDELERALKVEPEIVGVNQRDLRTFDVDRELAARLAPRIPDGVVRVAESGIRDADDVARVRDAGYDAVLVGESLVTAADPAASLKGLLGCS